MEKILEYRYEIDNRGSFTNGLRRPAAFDENGVITPVEKAIKGLKYFCMVCDEQWVVRSGKEKVKHFALKRGKKEDKNMKCTCGLKKVAYFKEGPRGKQKEETLKKAATRPKVKIKNFHSKEEKVVSLKDAETRNGMLVAGNEYIGDIEVLKENLKEGIIPEGANLNTLTEYWNTIHCTSVGKSTTDMEDFKKNLWNLLPHQREFIEREQEKGVPTEIIENLVDIYTKNSEMFN